MFITFLLCIFYTHHWLLQCELSSERFENSELHTVHNTTDIIKELEFCRLSEPTVDVLEL